MEITQLNEYLDEPSPYTLTSAVASSSLLLVAQAMINDSSLKNQEVVKELIP
ncbi:hypothetical protein [Paenibacillus alvei]|uniref:hypothetical protein n=1 Tax=Paenibacillus alvei TaxID=44250 RepID=UPI0013DD4F7E|nr:hypothetical protein [Paenibacillus alvei]NEZ43502.1 hypothetical protein [Paenibacillus alvei]